MATEDDSPARRPPAGAWRALNLALLPCLALLAACESKQDLSSGDCLPLRAPAQVTLVREAGLYAVGDAKTPVLSAHPRDTTNDAFHGTRLLRTVLPGTRIAIERLQQAHGFDVGKGRISAFGTLPGGERFEYGWGGGTTIGRAPWEPLSVPNLRTVACGD
ncbi:MAG: hypothetical protein EOO24_11570 [Comamonadaceae bacterium]|nr:MAG: hypothetical protein EOO24_11570 [Comamonadaceae bacterium]